MKLIPDQLKTRQIRARRLTQIMTLAAVAFVAAVVPVLPAYGAGGFSFDPGNGSYRVGDTLTVSVIVDTGSEPTNAVAADFSYPANLLQYISSDATGTAFGIAAADNGGDGSVSYHRGTITPVTGRNLVAKANFKVLAAGTATLSFKSSSTAVSSNDNKTNVATGLGTALFSLAAPPTPPPSNPPPAQPQPQPQPAPKPAAPAPAPPRRPSVTVTPVVPQGDPAPIPLVENDAIEVEAPIDVQPFTIKPDGISKIEYLLNDKLVKTVNVAPYKYRIDTTKMLNGKYKLTTKTHYTNGTVDTASQTLVVSNPFGLTQFRLLIQKYIALILFLLVLAGGAIALVVLKRRREQEMMMPPVDVDVYGGTDNPSVNPAAGYYGNPEPTETIITPTDRDIRF